MQLRYVDKTSNLAQLIINQHVYLEDIDPDVITLILKGKTNHNVLLLLDGYDEYTPGTNKDIDKLIKQGIGNCFVILTSRPAYLDKQTRDRFDGEISIEGFSSESISLCSEKYLQSKDKSYKLLLQAEKIGIDNLLNVPIVLLMTCVIFEEKQVLPKRKTELVQTIFELCMDRTTLKTFNKRSSDLKHIDKLLHKLGEFAWNSLQNGTQQLLLNKVMHYSIRIINSLTVQDISWG